MKKTITINLGGVVFSIDEDAYELLKVYLDKIESHFSDEGERNDILADIESRMAELFSEGNSARIKPVTIYDVEQVIAIMGDPGDIGEMSEEGGTASSSENIFSGRKTNRRIYRDVDNRLLGGVCSGISAYWSIDVVWIRIIFVILTLMVFSGVLVYLLLWLVIPPALTTAQKLEMRGEPVNINNIGKTVKEEFESVKKNFKNTFGKTGRSRKS
jgi:phage shock protein PspC (stress-responsive transcriptional regulator)